MGETVKESVVNRPDSGLGLPVHNLCILEYPRELDRKNTRRERHVWNFVYQSPSPVRVLSCLNPTSYPVTRSTPLPRENKSSTEQRELVVGEVSWE